MSTYDPLGRGKYLDLPTHQKRLRHLRSIAARNLALPLGCTHSDVSHLISYFTLHTDCDNKDFYRSEHVKGSLNPIWRSFDLSRIPGLDVTLHYLVVKVWLGEETNAALSVEWKVDLTGLKHLGDQIVVEGKKYPSNSLIFGMWDGYFGLIDGGPTVGSTDEPTLLLEPAQLRPSYSLNMLTRVYSVLRAIKQTEALVGRVRQSIEDQLIASKSSSEKLSEKELLILKVSKLRTELECRSAQLNAVKISHEQIQAKNRKKDSTLHNQNTTLGKDYNRLKEKRKSYFDAREKFVKTNAQLIMRKKQLIAELASIYPVLEIPPQVANQNGSPYFTICGVKLPNSEDFQGQDETMVAVALGYTAHMVSMIAQFLDVPLRYIIQHKSAKSKVHDHITDKLSDKDRDFPLYGKGKDKFHFNYAVYLLNKNIAQVRYYCGMGTNDLRLTLPNLKALLEMRLGVKFEEQPDGRTKKLLSVITSGSNASHTSGSPSPVSNQQTNDMISVNGPITTIKNSQSTSNGQTDHKSLMTPQAVDVQRSPRALSGNSSGSNEDRRLKSKFDISVLNDQVDSAYSQDKSHEPPSTEVFEAQFIKPENVTQTFPGFRAGADICDSGEGSSSDENVASKYSAKFKTWQHNPRLGPNDNLSDNEHKQTADIFYRDPSRDIIVSDSKTFKTKAMNENASRSAGSQHQLKPDSELLMPAKSNDVFVRAESFNTSVSSFKTVRKRAESFASENS